jgi:hypothetical protein
MVAAHPDKGRDLGGGDFVRGTDSQEPLLKPAELEDVLEDLDLLALEEGVDQDPQIAGISIVLQTQSQTGLLTFGSLMRELSGLSSRGSQIRVLHNLQQLVGRRTLRKALFPSD